MDIADDGGRDVLRIYCSTPATTSQRVARVADIITVDGNDINLSAGGGPKFGTGDCGETVPWCFFEDVVVTHGTTSGGYLYVQDQSRAAGIRVNRGDVSTSVTRGDTIALV